MKRRMTRVGVIGLALVAVMAIGAAPATVAKKKKKKKAVEVTRTATFSQCVSTSVPIPDFPPVATTPRTSASFSIPVSLPTLRGGLQDGAVTAFTSAGVRISHTFDADLLLHLVSPGGKAVTLAAFRDQAMVGTGGDGYGSGAPSCSGGLVLFGDLFTTPIATPGNTGANQPITGNFKPESPLSVFVGGPARGNWTLVVTDIATVDTGAINALSLNFTYTYKALQKVKKKKKKKK